MILFIIKKISYSLLVLFGVLTVIFFLFNVLPGDPARMMLDQREDSYQLELIKKKYAFDRSLAEQYVLYLNDISPLSFHSNHDNAFTSLNHKKYSFIKLFSFNNFDCVFKIPYLRESFVSVGTPVTLIIKETFKNTFFLAICAIIFALILGIFLGVVSALYKDTLIDKLILFFSVIGVSLPSFFASIIIAWIFGFILHSYTGLSMTGSLFEIDDYGEGSFISIKNIILPAFTLGIRPLAIIIQLSRNSILDVLSMDYIRTAKSKGLSNITILYRHVLKNALNPIITATSGWFASLLAGAVFVEYIFGWNGIGKEIVDALDKMDLPVIMGIVLFIGTLFVLINILVDLIYAWIDPRVKI